MPKTRSAADRGAPPFAQFAQAHAAMLGAAARAQVALLREATAMQAHLMAFAARRVERDLEAARKLMDCRAAPEAADLARDFCEQAQRDYAEEARTLVDVAAASAQTARREAGLAA